MRSSLTFLRAAGLNARTASGLLAVIGTLVASPRFAHAQDAASTTSDSGTTSGTDATKPASDTPVAPPESQPSTGDAASAKAQAEIAAPAEGDEAATEVEAPPEVEQKEALHALYLSADFAFTRADVGAFSDNTGFDKTGANGLSYGFGLGYRIDHFRVGARFHVNDTTEYNLWSVMAEVGYGFGFRPISPTIHLHGGYVFDTRIDRPVIARSLPQGNLLTPDADLRGARVGLELVGNIWLSETVRVGPFVGFDLLFLSRPKLDLPQSIYPTDDATRANPLFSGSGSGTGYFFNAGVRGTFDIGF